MNFPEILGKNKGLRLIFRCNL